MREGLAFVTLAIMFATTGLVTDISAAPQVTFVEPPTPPDGAIIEGTSVEIQASISEAALATATFNWNGVDYTLYDDSLVLMFNFDNVLALGEDYDGADAAPGDLVKDLSGWGNDGYLSDGQLSPDKVPRWIPDGRYGGAFDFTGNGEDVGQSIRVPHSSSLNPGSGDFAIAFWILTRDDYDGDVIRKGSTYTAGTWYKVEHAPSGPTDYIYWELNTDGTDASVYSTNVYNDNRWHFVFAQRKNDPGGDVAELWIDGVLNGTDSVSGSISNDANLSIGSKNTQDDDFINSSLDEVRIYMRSFGPAEIQELYYSNLSKYDADKWALYVSQSYLAEGIHTYQASASNIQGQTNMTEQRTVRVLLPHLPTVVLSSPSNESVLNHTRVVFTCSATDNVELRDATLYVGRSSTTVTFSGSAQTDDAQISADQPNTNFGTSLAINVDGANPHAHAVIKFPDLFGSGPGRVPIGSTIVSATLGVNCYDAGNLMKLYRLTENWVEGEVTWNQRASDVFWTNPGADGSGSNAGIALNGDCTTTGWKAFNITQFVQEWSDGAPNYGVVLTDTGSNGVDFDSSESSNPPFLTVTYISEWEQKGYKELSGTVATVTFDPIDLADQQDYVWNCLISNTSLLESWAPTDFHLTIDTRYPDEPVLVAPANDASGVPTSPTLEVIVSDPQNDPLNVTFYGRKVPSARDEFTIVVLPDSQNYCEFPEYSHIFTMQTQWIVNNIASRNIVFVTHEGDIVEHPSSTAEYDLARASMSVLDPGLADLSNPALPDPCIAYGVLPGNHNKPTGPPPDGYYNQYFPYTHYQNRNLSWYGGHYPDTGNDNSYQLFSAGGVDFIILHLEYNPSSNVISWADTVLKTHANRMAIITTHAYLNTDGSLLAEGNSIWNTLVINNDNVYFVLCGHSLSEYTRTDEVNGRRVHQLLADYEGRNVSGDGWLRIMRFAPAEDKVYVQTYSPYLGSYETDADSQFTLDVPLDWFGKIGTNTGVVSGSHTSVVWENLSKETAYKWYVTVTDSTGRKVVSPAWRFTTMETSHGQHTLNISSTAGGSVSSPGEGQFQYEHGTSVPITAAAQANYHFVNWTGSAVDAGKVTEPNTASTTVAVDADYTLRAYPNNPEQRNVIIAQTK